MLELLRTYLEECKSPQSIVGAILDYNKIDIIRAISASFDKTNIVGVSHIQVKIDALSLFEYFPEIMKIFEDFTELKTLISIKINIILENVLIKFGYKNLDMISLADFFIISYIFVTIPFTNPSYIKRENLNYERQDMHLKAMIQKPYPITYLEGKFKFIKKEIKSIYSSFQCTNIKCANHSFLFLFDHFYHLQENSKIVRRILREIKICECCKSELVQIKEVINIEHKYIVNFRNKYMYALISSSVPYEYGVMVGILNRNQKGQIYLQAFNSFSASKINRQFKHSIKSKSINKYLCEYSGILLPFKKDIDFNDCLILIILNIFNCNRCSKENLNILESPISNNYRDACADDDFLYSFNCDNTNHNTIIKAYPIDESYSEQIKSIKIIIYTNDVHYIKSIAANLIKEKIVYALESLKNNDSCLCIRNIEDKNNANLSNLADHVFYIQCSMELEYSYELASSLKLPERQVRLNSRMLTFLQILFVEFRKTFKGIIKPARLLATLEGLVFSMVSILDGMFDENDIICLIKKYFRDKVI